MPVYSYKAKDSGGGYKTGRVEAPTEADAIDEISRMGLLPVSLEQGSGMPGLSFNLDFKELLHGRVGLPELVMLCRQMYSLSKAGVPIIRAIGGLADSTDHYGLKKSLSALNRDLIGGRSLTQAMGDQPKIYNSLFVSMINVGENTGRLEDVFFQLAEYFTLEQETRKRITSAMRYPFMVIIFIGVAIAILNIWVIPVFSTMFGKFGVELPLTTRILIGTSAFFVSYWPYMLGFIVALPFLIRRALKIKKVRYHWDRLKLKIPVIGSILRRALLGRFCRSFSLMLRAGVQLNMALTLVASAIDNRFLEDRVNAMRREIEHGNSLATVAMQSNMFTPLVLQMFAVGDETGRVDELLLEAALHYEREVDYELKALTSKIEPLLLVFVALLVGVLALGIFTPMWDMYGAMQGK
ncbi:type II secretion system F family protein [Succinimonas sp.]|uniref:type II secretion system F family protein n=1 Tax=Succinimonas sp. TaxID=1936151 RepID=UPI00386925A0